MGLARPLFRSSLNNLATGKKRRALRLTVAEMLETRVLLTSTPYTEFVDPNPNPGNRFGEGFLALPNGNVVITSPGDDAGGMNAGAVYLFDGSNGNLISTATGSTADDFDGAYLRELANGDYVVDLHNWDNGAATNAGALLWGDASTGVAGTIGPANSLVGSSTNDAVSSIFGVFSLENGNHVFLNANWDNGAAINAGALTFIDINNPPKGAVSAANSLVGTRTGDLANLRFMELTNGNYVVGTPLWDTSTAQNVGAVTWGSGTTGVSGEINATRSLIGQTGGDVLGDGIFGLTALANGNYAVLSEDYSIGGVLGSGAFLVGNGTTGSVGVVDQTNSLHGTTSGDFFNARVDPLPNGNLVLRTPSWDNGSVANAGAATFVNGTAGLTGAISATTSLVGSTIDDRVGESVNVSSDGDYYVSSYQWDNGAATNAGAVTFGSGTAGVSGVVSSANSLVGIKSNDTVGSYSVIPLANGEFALRMPEWINPTGDRVGAFTILSGSMPTVGDFTAANSLTGSTNGDFVSLGGVKQLPNGKLVVGSPLWDNGGAVDAGAVTIIDPANPLTGPVTVANSAVGSSANDKFGTDNFNDGNVSVVTDDIVMVKAYGWDDGGTINVGIVTFINTNSPLTGPVNGSNSLIGSSVQDQVGRSVDGLTPVFLNRKVLVYSGLWDNGSIDDASAVTLIDPNNPITGVVSAANSLVGTSSGDALGDVDSFSALLPNGNFLLSSSRWDNGGEVDAGAVTFINSNLGLTGTIDATNSLVGADRNDRIGEFASKLVLDNGNFIIWSRSWGPGDSKFGAYTWGSGIFGVSGVVSAANSVVGSTDGDASQSFGFSLGNGNFVALLPGWDNGGLVDAGAATLINGKQGTAGVISAANSLVGTAANTELAVENGNKSGAINPDLVYAARFRNLDNGKVLVRSQFDTFPQPQGLVAYDGSNGNFTTITSNRTAFTSANGPDWDQNDGWMTFLGDFDGDGDQDIAGYRTAGVDAGKWRLALNDGNNNFTVSESLRWSATAGWRDFHVGDFNGDGRDDIGARNNSGQWWMVTGNGTGFDSSAFATWNATGWVATLAGDFNGDGMQDIAGLHDSGQWWIGSSIGALFANAYGGSWASQAAANWQNFVAGDFNGDGQTDVAAQTGSGQWFTGTSAGSASNVGSVSRFVTGAGNQWSTTAGFGPAVVGDFTGDGRDDIAGRNANGEWYVQIFDANTARTRFFGRWGTTQNWSAVVGDFDGDGRDDIAGFDAISHGWHVSVSNGNAFQQRAFGFSNGLINPVWLQDV